MATIHTLVGWHMQAVKSKETDGDSGETIDVWTLVLTDRTSGDQIRVGFRKDVRDEIVRQLTEGIVLAGGKLPNL